MDLAAAGLVGELPRGNADLPQQALEWIAAAGGDGDLRHVPLALRGRQAHGARIGHGVVGAGRDLWDDQLLAPLAELEDQRDVRPRGNVREHEAPVRLGQRGDQGRTAGEHAALVAHDARRERLHRRVGDVDDDVVEGILRRGIEDHAAHRGGRQAAARAVDLLALQADAGVPARIAIADQVARLAARVCRHGRVRQRRDNTERAVAARSNEDPAGQRHQADESGHR